MRAVGVRVIEPAQRAGRAAGVDRRVSAGRLSCRPVRRVQRPPHRDRFRRQVGQDGETGQYRRARPPGGNQRDTPCRARSQHGQRDRREKTMLAPTSSGDV